MAQWKEMEIASVQMLQTWWSNESEKMDLDHSNTNISINTAYFYLVFHQMMVQKK